MQNRLDRQEEEAETRRERQEIRRLQMQQMRMQLTGGLPTIVAPPVAAVQPLPATPKGVRIIAKETATAASSSLVSGPGKEDSRKVVKDFFRWLIARQDKEDRAPFQHAERVALEEMWTVKDL